MPGPAGPAGHKAAFGIGAAALMIVCCAGPALVVGGALATVGQLFASPVFVAAVLVVVIAGLALVLGRRHRGNRECCPPARRTPPEKVDDQQDF